jgi:hypothetical protein
VCEIVEKPLRARNACDGDNPLSRGTHGVLDNERGAASRRDT